MPTENPTPYEMDPPPPPPFPELVKEAERIVNLEQAVRWERAHRGISVDGIDDWKRKDIIVVYLILTVVVATLVYFLVR